MSQNQKHTNPILDMLFEQQIPNQFSHLKELFNSIFSIGKSNRLQKFIPAYEGILVTLKGATVDDLSASDAKSLLLFFNVVKALMLFVLEGLKNCEETKLDKQFDTHEDFIHFRNVVNNIIENIEEVKEALELMADEDFNRAFKAVSVGDLSEFDEA